MKKLKKTILRIMPIFFMYATKVNAADVVSEVQGGGSIQIRTRFIKYSKRYYRNHAMDFTDYRSMFYIILCI